MSARLTVAEAATRIGCSQQTVRNMIKRGSLRSTKRNGKVTIAASAVASAAKQHKPRDRQTAAADPGDEILTRAEVADMLSVDERTVTRWRNECVLQDYRRKSVERFMSDRVSEAMAIQKAKTSRARKEAAEAELAELKLAQARGNVYIAAQVEQVVKRLAGATRTELQGLSITLPAVVDGALVRLAPADRENAVAAVRGALIVCTADALKRLGDILEPLHLDSEMAE